MVAPVNEDVIDNDVHVAPSHRRCRMDSMSKYQNIEGIKGIVGIEGIESIESIESIEAIEQWAFDTRNIEVSRYH